jgi:DNA-binding transcriptional LysR family regulator
MTPLYEERYVLLAPDDLVPEIEETITWTQAAQLPLALLSQEMSARQFIDDAFAQNDVRVGPVVESDSIASLYAAVGTGRWASIVSGSWMEGFRMEPLGAGAHTRTIPLTDPELRTQIVVAINAAKPGSAIARAFTNAAVGFAAAFTTEPPRHVAAAGERVDALGDDR